MRGAFWMIIANLDKLNNKGSKRIRENAKISTQFVAESGARTLDFCQYYMLLWVSYDSGFFREGKPHVKNSILF